MKKARKIVSIIVTLCFLLTLVPAGAFAAPKDTETPFDDVQTTDWFYDTVQYVYDEGLMAGTGDRIFSPQQTTTRGMIVTILHRMAGSPEAEAQDFTDVDPDAWYAPAISWSIESGVGAGYGGGLFGPDDAITREQMASFLYRYAELKGYDVSAVGDLEDFADASAVSDWAEDVMSWAVGSDLFAGRDNNQLAPQGLTTRAEAATILMRYCENIVGTSAEDPSDEPSDDPSTEPDTPDVDDPSEDNPSVDPTPDDPSTAETFTVTFDSDGGSAVAAQKVKDGEKAKEPLTPTKDGFVFMGWQLTGSAESYDFSEPVTGDLSLVAIWATDVGDGDSIYTLENEQICFDEEEQIHYVNDILLAFVDKGLTDKQKQEIAESVNGSIAGELSGDINVLQIQVVASELTKLEAMAGQLMTNRWVNYATREIPLRTDELQPTVEAKAAPNNGDWWYSAVRADDTWEEYETFFAPITVGVIDNGINDEHEDLSGKVFFASNFYDEFNANFGNEDINNLDHGTAVTGVLAGKKNDNDVTGIAHNSDVVFASWRPTVEADWGTQLSELHALNTTLVSDPKVINCSFGMTYTSEAEFTTERAIEQMQLDANEEMGQEIFDAEKYYTLYNTYDEFRQAQDNSFNERSKLIAAATCEIIKNRENDLDKDFLIVQAAGNGMDNRGPGIDAWYSSEWAGVTAENAKEACESTGVSYADLKDHFIIAGGNTMIENGDVYTMEPYYNYGEAVDIYAPGVNIYSTASRQEGSSGETSDYAITQGTSFSAPIVSGVAALVWSVDPTLTAGEVKDILLNNYTCTAQGTFSGETYTAPVVDAYESVKAAVNGLDSVLGRVVEADTDPKVPLQNVTVTVSDASGKEMSTVTTAETGAFTAIVDEPGTYTLTFSKDGYETVVKTDVKIQGRGTIGDIEMTSSVSGDNIFAQLPSEFVFTSGAGGWATELTLNDDGSFTGQYYDYNLGITGPNYPNGSAYICNFTGKFSTPQKNSEYVYTTKIESIEAEGAPGSVYYQDGVKYIVSSLSDAAGLSIDGEYCIYLSGCPLKDIDETFLRWASLISSNQKCLPVGVYGIGDGFVGESENSPWDKDYGYSYDSYRSELWPRYTGQSSLNFWPSSGAATLSLRFDWNGEQHAEIVASDYNGTGNYYVVLDFDDEYRSVKVDVTSVSGYNLEPWGGTSEGTLSAEYTLS